MVKCPTLITLCLSLMSSRQPSVDDDCLRDVSAESNQEDIALLALMVSSWSTEDIFSRTCKRLSNKTNQGFYFFIFLSHNWDKMEKKMSEILQIFWDFLLFTIHKLLSLWYSINIHRFLFRSVLRKQLIEGNLNKTLTLWITIHWHFVFLFSYLSDHSTR